MSLQLHVEEVRKRAIFLSAILDTFPKAFSVGTAGPEGSGFLLLFRMFHFTLNLEPGLRPQKSCFRATEENLLHSLLLFCKNRKLKAILIAACGAEASQWSKGLLKIYWSAWLPSLILVPNNSAVRWLPPICKSHLHMLLPTRQFPVSISYASQSPQCEQSQKGKCELLLIPILFPVLEQMPQSNARE